MKTDVTLLSKDTISIIKTRNEKWRVILFFTLYVSFFLLIFQPFGVNNYDPTHHISLDFLLGSVGFGLISGIIISIHEFIIMPYCNKKKTGVTILARLCLSFILLPFGIYLFYNVIGNFHDWKWSSFFDFIRDVSLMAILPMSLIYIYYNYIKIKKAYRILLNKPTFNPSEETQLITIESDNRNDSIILRLDTLLYIEAQDNYVNVYHLLNNEVKKQLLRTTMKVLESKLKEMTVVRCHRSYLVNINLIIKVKGNGNQMKLFLPNVKKPIPVSRSYISPLKEIIATHHK
ncbi:LytR/AlgR family response regulator transcription factor [Aquimarina algiphila]|uniref:LytR/AlgR family response regulator transcription factor n=1 Tax=Aquimarina algiphila TaxID=2047982 RepID=UPI002330DDF6|nr:LytTR family DNA-binding domain-containing protein [Aquimarina algiphila]